MSLAFVGHLGKDELATATAALATVWLTYGMPPTGFVTAIDIFLAQSYGANQYANFGVWAGKTLSWLPC